MSKARKNQKLEDITDDQIKKAYELKDRGFKLQTISESTGITHHSLQNWFTTPPNKFISRIINSKTLNYLINSNLVIKASTEMYQYNEINLEERRGIPLVDRRGTGTGYGSSYSINQANTEAQQINSDSPILVTSSDISNEYETNFELTTHEVSSIEKPSVQEKNKIIQLEKPLKNMGINVKSKNLLELNDKVINYKSSLEKHLEAVSVIINNLETLTYIETLENAESEYQKRIDNLEAEINRLKAKEKLL